MASPPPSGSASPKGERPEGPSPLHVEAAAYAALRAVEHWQPGVFNIAEPQAEVTSRKAVDVLGWRADFRLQIGRA